MKTLENLESISHTNGTYTLRFERKVKTSKQVAHPVFTNMDSMTDKVGRSRVYKNIATVEGERTETELTTASKQTAKAWLAKAHQAGLVGNKEDLENGNWVLRIGG